MFLNILTTGGICSLIFTIFVLAMARTGVAAAMRDPEGNFRRNPGPKAILGGIAFVAFLLGMLFFGNWRHLQLFPEIHSFGWLWVNAFSIFMLVHIYDLVVLDLLVVVLWHPKFLNLPDTPYYSTITPHVRGFIRGIPIGVLASLLAAGGTMVIM